MAFDTYKVAEARAHFSALLNRAKAGEEILITKGKELQARLVPPPEVEKREPAPLAHLRLPDDLFDGDDSNRPRSTPATTVTMWGIWRGSPAAS